MKFGLQFRQAALLLLTFLLSVSTAFGQIPCPLEVQTPAFAYSANTSPAPGFGSFDLSIDYDGLDCHGGGEGCLCECFLKITFDPIDPIFLDTYPNAFDVVDIELQANQQTIIGTTPPSSIGYYADENVLVVSLGVNTNTPAGTLFMEFTQSPPAPFSVSQVDGICVIDNIDKPYSPERSDMALYHFGLNDPDPIEDPRTIPE